MVFEKLFPVVILFFVGYGLKRTGILKEGDGEFLGRVLVNFVIPLLFLQILWETNLNPSLLWFPIVAIGILSTFLVTGFIFSKIFQTNKKTQGSIITSFATLEGSIGYALMLAAFGEFGLSRIILLDIGNVFFLFGIIYPLTHFFGNEGTRIKESLFKIVKNPMVWGVFGGVVLNLIGFQSQLVSNTASIVTGGTILLITLLLGIEFKPRLTAFGLPIIATIVKSMTGIGLGVLVSSLLGVEGVERIAIIIWATLPPSFLNIVFAKENNLDTTYTSNLLSIAIPIGIIFLATLIGFL